MRVFLPDVFPLSPAQRFFLVAFLVLGLLSIGCSSEAPSDSGAEVETGPSALWSTLQRLEDQRIEGSEELEDALAEGEETERVRAARAMGRIQSTTYAEALAAATQDPEAQVRREALFALGQLGLARGATPPPPAVQAAQRILGGEEDELKPLAAEALGKLAPDGAAQELTPLLAAQDDKLRAAAAHALFRLRFVPVWRAQVEQAPELPEAAVEALAGALADPSVEVRRAAAHAFSRYDAAPAVAALAEALGDPDPWVRVWSVRALGRSGDAVDPDSLQPALQDADAQVRTEAVLAARRLEVSSVVPLALAEDGSFHVRAAVAAALGSREDGESLSALRTLAEDASVTVRAAAVQALAQRRGADFVGQLETLAQDEDWRLRLAAAQGAAATALDGAGRPVLERLVEDPDSRVLTSALRGLVAAGDAAPAVEEALTADDLAVRGTAVLLVPEAGLSDPLVSLGRALEASTGYEWVEIRESVVDALAQVEGGESLLNILAQEDPAPSVRSRARTALAQEGVSAPAAPATEPPGPSPLLGQAPAEDVRVVLQTSRGDLVLRVLASEAPVHAANFLDLVDRGFYDGLLWHRVVSNFVIQGGDPRGDGWGSGERTLRDEINPVPFRRGTVGMPKAGKDTGGCQIFITHLPTPHLDGNYTVFGQVEEGLEVIDLLEVGDRIESARRL